MATNQAVKHETLPIIGMTCANCVATIERNVKKLPGIQAADVNLANERMTVAYDPTFSVRLSAGTPSDLVLDRIVEDTGTYHATATQTGVTMWIFALYAFALAV